MTGSSTDHSPRPGVSPVSQNSPALDISIIIISFNTRDITRDCLASVVGQPRAVRATVIVVDNDSTDGSVEMIAAEFPSVHLIRNARNVGFAAANNQGIRESAGEYILLLNSDTIVLGDVLPSSLEFMRSHPDVAVLGCRVLNADRTVQDTCFRYPSLLHIALKTSGLFHIPWPHVCGREHYRGWRRDTEKEVEVATGCYMMVRRKAVEQVGVLDESFFFCGEETDWCLRFRRAGWKVVFSPVGEIIHIGNASGRTFKARRDVMLSEGIVRLHRKHQGLLSAVITYCLLWVFNVTHWIGWSGLAFLGGSERSKARRDHFQQVVRGFGAAWPHNRETPPSEGSS